MAGDCRVAMDDNIHGGDEQNDDSTSNYKILETAAFYNNQMLVLDWLKNSKDQGEYKSWRESLLRKAAYWHSVDVVRCITSFGNCDG